MGRERFTGEPSSSSPKAWKEQPVILAEGVDPRRVVRIPTVALQESHVVILAEGVDPRRVVRLPTVTLQEEHVVILAEGVDPRRVVRIPTVTLHLMARFN